VCLFGEHQDYLGFPVIAAAIDRYIFIDAEPFSQPNISNSFKIELPDIPGAKSVLLQIPPDGTFLSYENKRDYLRSGINVALKANLTWSNSWNVKIHGTIPINAGASSSSAMVIAWLRFLWAAADHSLDPSQLGTYGYQTEVAEFGEAGGMMDHFASAVGGLIYVESIPAFKAMSLPASLQGFVLSNSKVKKNTVDDLKRVKATALSGFQHLKELFPKFDKYHSTLTEVEPYLSNLIEAERKMVYGNLIDRDLTKKAFNLLQKPHLTDQEQIELGQSILKHHEMLSQFKGVSHPTVDKMVQIATEAGAIGAKINGSGFGGTMVAYAPTKQKDVVQALLNEGFDSWAIEVSPGANIIS
jgi:galactokinase